MKLTLGEKIKELRKRDGRKQEDLACALGVSNQAVSRWEKDGSYPDMEMIPAIAICENFSVKLTHIKKVREKPVYRSADQNIESDHERKPCGKQHRSDIGMSALGHFGYKLFDYYIDHCACGKTERIRHHRQKKTAQQQHERCACRLDGTGEHSVHEGTRFGHSFRMKRH